MRDALILLVTCFWCYPKLLPSRRPASPAGNAYTGIGIPDCIRMGRAAAEKVLAG